MSRAKYQSGELDGATKIGEGIKEALRRDGRATVTFDAVEKVYEMVEDSGDVIEGDLDAKCRFICEKFGCTCTRNDARRECVLVRR